MPEVSVIIPTYNRAGYVTKAIDSVLAQNYKDYEIIVIDDGSTDNTGEILKPYFDNITYIYQPNSGVSAARNNGIKSARGQWIAFLDSDDEWMPEKLSVQMDFLSRHSDVVACISNVKFVFSDHEVNLFEIKNYSNNGEENSILERPLTDVLSIFFFSLIAKRKTIVDIGCFDESMSIFEDADLMRRLALEGPWAVSNQCLALIFRREESPELNLSRQNKDRLMYSYECLVRGYEKIKSDNRLQAKEKNLVNATLSAARFKLGLEQIKSGMKQEGMMNARQSFLDCPSLKSFIKYLIVRTLREKGIFLIEKRSCFRKKGFRRSDYSPSYKQLF